MRAISVLIFSVVSLLSLHATVAQTGTGAADGGGATGDTGASDPAGSTTADAGYLQSLLDLTNAKWTTVVAVVASIAGVILIGFVLYCMYTKKQVAARLGGESWAQNQLDMTTIPLGATNPAQVRAVLNQALTNMGINDPTARAALVGAIDTAAQSAAASTASSVVPPTPGGAPTSPTTAAPVAAAADEQV